MVEVVAPIRPPEPVVPPAASPEPRLTAIQERMARLSEKDGGVLVGGTAQPETPLPATEAAGSVGQVRRHKKLALSVVEGLH